MKKIIKILALSVWLFLIACSNDDESPKDHSETLSDITDIEGNSYPVRKIGDQIWMVQNLATKTYNDGTPILEITNSQDWFLNGEAGFSWYNNSKDEEATVFGALYNWYAVESGKLCPEGWHIPSIDEFTELVRFVGGESNAGIHLKSTEFWEEPATESLDSYGFFALPVGFRYFDGTFKDRFYETSFWTSSKEYDGNEYSDGSAWTISLRSSSESARNFTRSLNNGYSCRCIKD